MNTSLLHHYRQDPNFRRLMEEIRSESFPVISSWKPQATQDENAALIESMKFSSAMQQGFDLLFNILLGTRNG